MEEIFPVIWWRFNLAVVAGIFHSVSDLVDDIFGDVIHSIITKNQHDG